MKSTATLPPLVAGVVRQWETLAFGAYEGFVRYGRVAMTIGPDESDPERISVGVKMPDDLSADAARLVTDYDPERAIVIEYREGKRAPRAACIAAPEENKTPREVWTGEMLSRVAQNPDSVDWGAVPPWFVVAVAQAGLAPQE